MKSMSKFPVRAAILLALFLLSLLLDKPVAKALETLHSSLLSSAVIAFNQYFFWIYGAMLGATALAMLLARTNRKGEKALSMGFSILSALALTYILKPIFHRLRPDGIIFINPLLGNADYSFPSGHATSAAAAAFSAPILKAPWMVFAALTAFSRLYSGVHFLSDTMAGVLVAAAVSAFISSRIKEKLTMDDKLELRRQLMHALVGIGIALFVYNYPSKWLFLIAIAAGGILLSWAVRATSSTNDKLLRFGRGLAMAVMDKVERKDALKSFPGKGAIMLFLGSGLTAGIFGKAGAAAIVILAIGDSVSPIAGRLLGRAAHRWIFIQEKMVEGTLFGIIFAAAGAALLVPVWTAIIASTVAMALEAIDIKIFRIRIDDNIIVPLAAGAVIGILAYF